MTPFRRSFIRHGIAAAFSFLVVPLTFDAAAKVGAERPPNVILFLADDLGWSDLNCYGSEFHETPHLDGLAAAGVKFLDAYAACTVCSPTRAAAMTGKYPARLHLTTYIPGHHYRSVPATAKLARPDWTQRLEQEEVTIAEVLRDAGYRTAHVGKWHLTPRPDPGNAGPEDDAAFNEYSPATQGFQKVIGADVFGSYYHPYGKGARAQAFAAKGKPGEYKTDRLAAEAVAIVEEWKEESFFLYFSFYNVHTPIEGREDLVAYYEKKLDASPLPEDAPHRNPAYAAMLHSLDEAVGRVLVKIAELGLAEDTVVLFSSDNGGLSHRGGELTNITRNDPLRRGKGSAYEGGTRVPLIVKWPGVTPAGHICTEPVCTIDFYPTILDIIDVFGDAAHNAKIDGTSLVPLLEDPAAGLSRDALYWHHPHYHPGGDSPYGAIRHGDWKLIEFYEDMNVELYNLRADLGEAANLAESEPGRVAELREKLHAWRSAVNAQMPAPNPNYTGPQPAR